MVFTQPVGIGKSGAGRPVRARWRDLLWLAIFTLVLHVPFLRQPVEGDEVTYLDIARQVFVQPLTPQNFQYVFEGRLVDAAGHPHPPLDAYLVALAWILRGHFSVLFFHAFYLIFALGIGFAAYALAARFTTRPLWAALLVAASPLVQVNTNTLAAPESPGLAFLLAGAAAFFWRRFALSGIALTLAGLTELQALAIAPVLLVEYAIRRERPPRAAWLAISAPYAGLASWQALQWALMGRLPGLVLFRYTSSLGVLRQRVAGAAALLQHLGVLVTPVPLAWRRLWGLGPGLLACLMVHDYPWWERALLLICVTLGVNALLWLWQARNDDPVLAAWCLLYFGFAVLVFFAGAARYLLPLVAPMVLLFVRQFHGRPGPLAAALAVSLFLGLNISFAAYEFSRVYTKVPAPPERPFLLNGDWGFRYYMLAGGGRVLSQDTVPRPGEWIVSSELSLGGNYDSLAEETALPLRTADLAVRSPLRLIDLHAHTGFSSAAFGLLPFSFSRRPLDRITYARTSPFLNLPAPWTPTQFSGHLVYVPEPGKTIQLPLSGAANLHFALFAHGRGQATFAIRRPSGDAIFERTVQVNGELWQPQELPLTGVDDTRLSITAPPDLRAGWGELVSDSGPHVLDPDVRNQTASQPPEAALSYLNLGDVRSRPQLGSGWYGIEEGSWRWMAKEAEVTLRTPADTVLVFEMQLFFPDSYMRAAGGPVTVSVTAGGNTLAQEIYTEPGGHLFAKPVRRSLLTFPVTSILIRLNRAMPPTGADKRELGAVVQRLGFVEAK
jgi:hypothetical protein